jgi:hypothetical protein
MVTPIVMPEGRRVVIDGNGYVHSPEADPVDIVADHLDTVLVLWNQEGGTSWLGWLMTRMRRSVSFSTADLADPVVQSWLRALPAWDHARLWHATTKPGAYIVWRRSQAADVGALRL